MPAPPVLADQTQQVSRALETAAEERCLALDAMRGFVMLALCWGVALDVPTLAKDPAFQSFASQFRHVPWEGLGLWELIMPTFLFVMGTVLPLALARRRKRGATFAANLRHVSIRALKLVLLGQILVCLGSGRIRVTPTETLTQLAICYFCCFLILQSGFRWQAIAAASLLAINWGLYALFPGSAGPFTPTDNIGVMIDHAVFGLNHAGTWVTINFLGGTVNMLFGAWTGSLLISSRPHSKKLKMLGAAATACFAVAFALMPFNPVIEKAWTSTLIFLGTGFALAGAAAFFWLLEVKGFRRLAFPLVVVGMNSIFIYVLGEALGSWIRKSVGVFTGRFQFLGPFGAIPQACAVVLVMWCVCNWLYRRKIFLKV